MRHSPPLAMRQKDSTVIHLHAGAPVQPPLGAPCNGCGVCCALSPCPLGRVLTQRLSGPCALLRWQEDAGLYRCGALAAAAAAPWPLRSAAQALAGRWIAAGQGCDCPSRAEPSAR
ncbi:hypothetical protein [Amphibiibacter pelophylacis]|uniref:Uncharacterized protein n=1 Tax=Amphibiibacter pelophylacis TaxID=1799477 RepID=A0ACC6P0W2_9BURK